MFGAKHEKTRSCKEDNKMILSILCTELSQDEAYRIEFFVVEEKN